MLGRRWGSVGCGPGSPCAGVRAPSTFQGRRGCSAAGRSRRGSWEESLAGSDIATNSIAPGAGYGIRTPPGMRSVIATAVAEIYGRGLALVRHAGP